MTSVVWANNTLVADKRTTIILEEEDFVHRDNAVKLTAFAQPLPLFGEEAIAIGCAGGVDAIHWMLGMLKSNNASRFVEVIGVLSDPNCKTLIKQIGVFQAVVVGKKNNIRILISQHDIVVDVFPHSQAIAVGNMRNEATLLAGLTDSAMCGMWSAREKDPRSISRSATAMRFKKTRKGLEPFLPFIDVDGCTCPRNMKSAIKAHLSGEKKFPF